MHKVLKNIITSEDLNYLSTVFDTEPHRHTQSMEKVDLPLHNEQFFKWAQGIIENRVDVTEPYVIVGDNFYKHSNSYFPHCDAIESTAWLNIVIPMYQWQPFGQQKFIVFDQTWTGGPATWIGSCVIQGDFENNKKRSERPCDGEYFQGGTDAELPEDVWQHLNQKYFTQNYFYSMSGTAYDWSPGDIIVFDSQHIHATGKMQSQSKLGVSIRIAHK